MYRYQILIEYDGTSRIGWQIQKKGESIQKILQKTFSNVLKEKIKIYGSGRTDKNVHSIEQSAHFDISSKILNINPVIKTLNYFLNKKNISILSIKKKNNQFHARHSAKKRSYIYLIRNNISRSVLNRNREWHIINKININLIKKGALKLLGTHDFSTFRASNCNSSSPIKTIYKINISKKNNLIKMRFVSKSFLKSQVRSMVGCLKYLGEKKWTLHKFEQVLKSRNRKYCAPLAPPHGLYLEKVTY